MQSANATLALGASPIMSNANEEMGDLGAITGSVLINIGTLKSDAIDAMKSAGVCSITLPATRSTARY